MTDFDTMNDGLSTRVKKGFFILLGTLSLALAFLGIFIPVLPTTPLVIFSAACYFRGSERLYNWILNSKYFGETIQNYRAGRGLKKSTKIRALSLMWVVIILSAFFFVENNLIRITMMAIAAIVSNYIIKLPTYISLDEGSAS